MAKMNREILVPYLQDVCALHLAKKKHQDHIAKLRTEADSVRKGAVLARPAEKEKVEYTGFMGAASMGGSAVGCGFLLFIPLFVILAFDNNYDGWLSDLFGILVGGGALVAGVCFVLHLFSKSSRNASIARENQQNLQNWEQQSAIRKANAEARCAQISNEISGVQRQISVIDGLLSRAYSANLIPSRYRDLYAAVYLYDWFSTGMSDDMDMALNTYVLEQIKSRLDTIIRNQAEQIINQRTIIANQARTMNMIERNAQEMREKVSRMNESLEKQNMYLSMIDSNVAATRYFAEETYKKWY